MLFDINYVIRGIYLIVQLLNYATHPHVIALIITACTEKQTIMQRNAKNCCIMEFPCNTQNMKWDNIFLFEILKR